MEYEILVFETHNSLNYWFKYICEFISSSNYVVRIDTKKEIINFGLMELRFITYPIENKIIGLHHSRIYENLETRLERNFKETLREILSKGE